MFFGSERVTHVRLLKGLQRGAAAQINNIMCAAKCFLGSERVSDPSPMLNFLKVYKEELHRSITVCVL